MPWARLLLATCAALTYSWASAADDMDVGDFLSRCSGLKPVLTGEINAALDDQTRLSWCSSHLSELLEDYRTGVHKRSKLPKTVSICLPEGMTDAELLLIVLDELQTHDRSASLAKVITSTLAAWWPCK
jgi:Rap1a immunity proteins